MSSILFLNNSIILICINSSRIKYSLALKHRHWRELLSFYYFLTTTTLTATTKNFVILSLEFRLIFERKKMSLLWSMKIKRECVCVWEKENQKLVFAIKVLLCKENSMKLLYFTRSPILKNEILLCSATDGAYKNY
jgi:hypothetical protein